VPRPRTLCASAALVGAALLWANVSVAQGRGSDRRSAPPVSWQAFTAAFDRFGREDGVVGGTVVVLQEGRVLATHAYGRSDPRATRAPRTTDVYHWASITKTLTAIAILQLRDRGKLSLDDPIVRYVPELRQVHDAYGPIEAVTLRMLLSHTAGFQNPTWPYGEGRDWEPFEPTRWDQLVAMMPYQEIGFRPGSRWGYSNPAFIYLARVVEALTGDPWAVYVQKNIWTPLGLTESFTGVSPYHLAARRAPSYTVRARPGGGTTTVANAPEFDPGITIPNGGWNAPVTDLVNYLAFLTHADHGDSVLAARYDGVLRRSTLAEMWRPVVPLASGSADESFGLSFYLYRRGRSTIVGHTGEQSGFRSFFFLDPSSTTAVVGVVNTTNEARPDSSLAAWDGLVHGAVDLVAR
jgi:CubicO group peptidase (beta-lactamase class C family)